MYQIYDKDGKLITETPTHQDAMYRFNTLPNAFLVTECYEVFRIVASREAIPAESQPDPEAPF